MSIPLLGLSPSTIRIETFQLSKKTVKNFGGQAKELDRPKEPKELGCRLVDLSRTYNLLNWKLEEIRSGHLIAMDIVQFQFVNAIRGHSCPDSFREAGTQPSAGYHATINVIQN